MTEKFSNGHFVEFCKGFVGQAYWYGCCVYACTQSLLDRKAAQYSSHYKADRMPKYKQAIQKHLLCADCVGLIKGYFWTNGGEKVLESIGKATPLFKNSYASNGMPDKSANGLFSYAKSKGMEWGTIDTIPEIPGLAVRFEGHVGVYIGNGKVVEERGFNYGCVITNLKDRNWLHWYKIPGINYMEIANSNGSNVVLGSRSLRKGSKGDDVKELQELLNTYFAANLKVDGDYGSATEAAVKKFQSTHNLVADGIYGEKTHIALMSAIADYSENEDEQQTPSFAGDHQYVTSAAVNARAGDSAKYTIVTTFAANTTLNVVKDKIGEPIISENNWYAVYCGNQIGWVSGKYVK